MTLAPLAAIDWDTLLNRKAAPKPPESWSFDTGSQRWRHGESGRPVAPSRIADVLAERQAAVKDALAGHGRALANGTMTPAQFQAAARADIKAAHIQARLLAIGGRENATPKDWGKVGNELRNQYGYLAEFAATPEMSEAYAANRASLYGGAAVKGTYTAGQQSSHAANGYDQARKVGPNDGATCSDCSEEIAQGWVPIEDAPTIGHTQCLSNCRCEVEFGKSGDGGEE